MATLAELVPCKGDEDAAGRRHEVMGEVGSLGRPPGNQRWLAGNSPSKMEVYSLYLGKSSINGGFSSKPCLIAGG